MFQEKRTDKSKSLSHEHWLITSPPGQMRPFLLNLLVSFRRTNHRGVYVVSGAAGKVGSDSSYIAWRQISNIKQFDRPYCTSSQYCSFSIQKIQSLQHHRQTLPQLLRTIITVSALLQPLVYPNTQPETTRTQSEKKKKTRTRTTKKGPARGGRREIHRSVRKVNAIDFTYAARRRSIWCSLARTRADFIYTRSTLPCGGGCVHTCVRASDIKASRSIIIRRFLCSRRRRRSISSCTTTDVICGISERCWCALIDNAFVNLLHTSL